MGKNNEEEGKKMSVSEKKMKKDFSDFKQRVKEKQKFKVSGKSPSKKYLNELEENAELLYKNQIDTME